MKKLIPALLFLLCGIHSFAADTTPRLLWQYSGQSNLYAAPLVGDIHPSPGLESIISDSEVRRLRCVSAQGETLWTFDGKWAKRLISSAALSTANQAGERLLLIGNGDGRLVCLDAASGVLRWEKPVGAVEWGGVLWADLDGDGEEEAVVGTLEQGIAALDRTGTVRWQAFDEGKFRLNGALAAGDVTGDLRAEIFGVGPLGPFCLNGDGSVRWASSLADGFLSAPLLADADKDGKVELFCTSREDNLLRCFDGDTGTLRWQRVLLGPVEVYAGSGVAVGDITGDGLAEVVVPDAGGHVQAFDSAGELRWVFKTKGDTHCAVTLGDVDGDSQVDVLVASGDHTLYCLDSSGQLQWKYETGLRLISPATITDIDSDGLTDILVCGSDKQLRCLTLGGAYDPEYIPWPSRRFNAAQTGFAVVSGAKSPASNFLEQRELLVNGGFEASKIPIDPQSFSHPEENQILRRKLPQAWTASQPSAAWSLSQDKAIVGESSLHIADGAQVLSEPVALPDGLTELKAQCIGNGVVQPPVLRWIGSQGVLQEDILAVQGKESDGTRYTLTVVPPHHARWVVMVLNAGPDGAYWDEASLLATVRTPHACEVLINQVGYEQHGPKSFVVQSNFVASTATFALVDENDEVVYEGRLKHQGRVAGYYGKDWGHEYWRSDFSAVTTPGTYRIRVSLDGLDRDSYSFAVAKDVLWKQTAELAYRFFYYQRCGMAIPGFHEICHLDDAVSPDGAEQLSLWGGWHDAGDYNTYHNAPYVYGLVRAYAQAAKDFSDFDRDGNGQADFLDEIIWGGEHARRMIAPDGSAYGSISSGYGFWGGPGLETDNQPGTGDERSIHGKLMGNDPSSHHAALARIATRPQGAANSAPAPSRRTRSGPPLRRSHTRACP
ncbi:MAG: PQQ-binding-like beta-propeller repeat protein, partial [Candidatus Hydrogenedentes bacterium]|nr:PQQ-binding-like beta-propeller repeat protein [Candidatus Hydrogenedentota bacterium]